MKTAYAVIGSNFGDEGKGKVTDALVYELKKQRKQVVVCRFNGGAQAGHTVTRAGRRHVFGHVGAGAFLDAPTYLASTFITNFFALDKEVRELRDKGVAPSVVISPRSIVTTLFDIKLNELIERSRGDNRHGSCGLGINETVTRSLAEGGKFQITADMVKNASESGYCKNILIAKLGIIVEEWIPKRARELGISDEFIREPNFLYTRSAIDAQADALINTCVNNCVVQEAKDAFDYDYDLVLEGAQGLGLDAEIGFFPHVTRSKTGLPYAKLAAEEMGFTSLSPIYCMRAYTTRHGAGPMSSEGSVICSDMHEADGETYSVVTTQAFDATNQPNEWQGTLRFAPLDIAIISSNITADINTSITRYAPKVTVNSPSLAITCLDQVSGSINIVDVNGIMKVDKSNLLEFISARLNMPICFTSSGPTDLDNTWVTQFKFC